MVSQPASSRTQLLRSICKDVSLMVVIGIVLAIIGPFGSIHDPLAIRLIVWVGYAVLGYALYRPIDDIAGRLVAVLDMPRWWLSIVACLIATVPMATFVWVAGFAGREIVWPDASTALSHYIRVLAIGGGITAIFYLVARANRASEAEPQESASAPEPVAEPAAPPVIAAPQPRLLERLPTALGSDIRALEMEDHYVRVHTALGSEMILLRLRDAIAELEGIEGMQVHRSWWVARGAVEDVVRDGRNVRLALGGELEAPVSRANVAVLRDGGWI